jgi:hypothetical protein
LPVAVRLLDYALAMTGAWGNGEAGGAVGQLAALRLAAEAAALRVLMANLESWRSPAVAPLAEVGDLINPAPAKYGADFKPTPLKLPAATIHFASQEKSR